MAGKPKEKQDEFFSKLVMGAVAVILLAFLMIMAYRPSPGKITKNEATYTGDGYMPPPPPPPPPPHPPPFPSPPPGGGVSQWAFKSVAILESKNTHLLASSSLYYADRNGTILLQEEKNSTTSLEKCAAACISALGESNVDAVSLTPPAPYALPACNCYKSDFFCVDHAVSNFGVPQSMIKTTIKKCAASSFSTTPILSKQKCPDCGRGAYCKKDTYAVGQNKEEGECVACVSEKGYYFTSCNADSSQKPCPPCPEGEYRKGCSGVDRGTCVSRRTCNIGEYPSISSAFTDTDCVVLHCPPGTEPSNLGTCASCPPGRRREWDLLFRDELEEVVLGFDIHSNRPMFSSLRGKVGYLSVSTNASNGSDWTTPLSPAYSHVYAFDEAKSGGDGKGGTGTERVFSAKIAVGWMSANGVFSADPGRFVDVAFYNAALPMKCIA